jgi:hypothetical protein
MHAGSGEFAAFEQHTRGFGSRYLAKFAYTAGAGLGRAGQGTAAPLVPSSRPGREGLGFVRKAPQAKARARPASASVAAAARGRGIGRGGGTGVWGGRAGVAAVAHAGGRVPAPQHRTHVGTSEAAGGVAVPVCGAGVRCRETWPEHFERYAHPLRTIEANTGCGGGDGGLGTARGAARGGSAGGGGSSGGARAQRSEPQLANSTNGSGRPVSAPGARMVPRSVVVAERAAAGAAVAAALGALPVAPWAAARIALARACEGRACSLRFAESGAAGEVVAGACGDDVEVVEPLRVLLEDPATGTRMRTPIRGGECEHLQCFDAGAFLERCSGAPGAQPCSVCGVALRVDDLRVDPVMAGIVAAVAAGARAGRAGEAGAGGLASGGGSGGHADAAGSGVHVPGVHVFPDGSWSAAQSLAAFEDAIDRRVEDVIDVESGAEGESDVSVLNLDVDDEFLL